MTLRFMGMPVMKLSTSRLVLNWSSSKVLESASISSLYSYWSFTTLSLFKRFAAPIRDFLAEDFLADDNFAEDYFAEC